MKKAPFEILISKIERIIVNVERYNKSWKTDNHAFSVEAIRGKTRTSVSGMEWAMEKNLTHAALKIYKLVEKHLEQA